MLTEDERKTLSEGEIAHDYKTEGGSAVLDERARERMRAGKAAEYGLDAVLGIPKGGDGGNIVLGDKTEVLTGVPKALQRPEGAVYPTQAPPLRPTGPADVRIVDQDSFTESMARTLGRITLNVQVRDPLNGSRGPLSPQPPKGFDAK